MTQPTPTAEPTQSLPYATWRFVGCSIRGADHQKSGKVNQDSVRSNANIDLTALPEADGQLQVSNGAQKGPMICAVSDGHGSDAYVRSEIGSDRAVGAAISSIESFLASCEGMPINAVERFAQDQLPKMILDRWQQEIRIHQQSLAESDDNFKPYGCTLVCCAVTDEFTLAVQLGDGGLSLLDQSGQLHLPIPPDPRFVGGLTSSLCDSDAINEFQIKLIPKSQVDVSLAIVCSDGLENCFSKGKLEQDFVANFQKFIQSNGIRRFADSLPTSLDSLSQKYSGDDITIGVLSRSSPHDVDYASEKSKLEWHENRSALFAIGMQSAEQSLEIKNALKTVEDRIQSLDLGEQTQKVDWIAAQLSEISQKLDSQLSERPEQRHSTTVQPQRGFKISVVVLIAAACLLFGGALGYLVKPGGPAPSKVDSNSQNKKEQKPSAPFVATETDEPATDKVDLKVFEGEWFAATENGLPTSLVIGPYNPATKKESVVLKIQGSFMQAGVPKAELRGELKSVGDLVQFFVKGSDDVYTVTEDKPNKTITLQRAKKKESIGPFTRVDRS